MRGWGWDGVEFGGVEDVGVEVGFEGRGGAQGRHRARLHGGDRVVGLGGVEAAGDAGGLNFVRALRRRAEVQPFLLALLLFLLSFIGLGVSMFPWLVRGKISIYAAATAENGDRVDVHVSQEVDAGVRRSGFESAAVEVEKRRRISPSSVNSQFSLP